MTVISELFMTKVEKLRLDKLDEWKVRQLAALEDERIRREEWYNRKVKEIEETKVLPEERGAYNY